MKDQYHKEELERMARDFEAQIQRLREEHDEEVDRLQAMHTERLSEVVRAREKVESALAQKEAEFNELRASSMRREVCDGNS